MSKKNAGRLNAFWTGAILVSLCIVLFALIFVSCAKPVVDPPEVENPVQDGGHNIGTAPDENTPTADPDSGETQTVSEPENTVPPEEQPEENAPVSPKPEQNLTELAETEDMGREYLEKIYFLGDSTTYGIGYYYDHGYTDLAPSSHVWTPASGTLTLDQWNYVAIVNPDTGEELMLPDLVALKKPEYLCITLGVNGVSFMKEEYFKESYTALVKKVQEVSPETTVILNSIYPVTVGYEAKNNGINNLKIEAANLWVSAVAQECGVHYLNSASVLMNENRVLPDEYTNGDGLHLNGEAFGLVVDYIRTHGC